jgi:hypothetical protein
MPVSLTPLRSAQDGAHLRTSLSLLACVLGCAMACQGRGGAAATSATHGKIDALDSARLDGSRWSWVEAECSDGALELGRVGLDRELSVQADGEALRLIFETELATDGCYSSAEWSAKPSAGESNWRFKPRALLTLPPDAQCGPVEHKATNGTLRVLGDQLEMVTQRSGWCRGFDARFVYRRSQARPLSERQVVARYAGAFNRRDADGMAQLFAASGSLVEPFTRTEHGNHARHEGRDAVRKWYASAFESAAWLGMRVTSITKGRSAGHVIADWDYMDAHLARPLRGRNLFVIAGGEIYETEVQLVDDPQPLPENVRNHAAPAPPNRPPAP